MLKYDIRSLNWKQPFASLMLVGKIETRTWATNYRGMVLICASKIPYSDSQLMKMSGIKLIQQTYNLFYENDIIEEHGKAIAIGNLIDFRKMTQNDENKCFLKYNPKLWCHVYDDNKPLDYGLINKIRELGYKGSYTGYIYIYISDSRSKINK